LGAQLSIGGKEYAFAKELCTRPDGIRIIHGEDLDGRPSDGGPADQIRAVPAKMSIPLVTPG
jgi:hypothetical protein